MTHLTIARIATQPFRLPMHGTLQWGKHSRLAEARHVLVTVELSDGAVGHAEAPPRPTIYGETTGSICHVIAGELAPRLLGRPAEQAAARLAEVRNNHTAKGAIDMALHAALAVGRGTSLAEHLGATQERLRVSYILGIGDRETVLAEAAAVVQAGVRVLKVKVGREWDEDLARIDELQTLLGPAVALYADANECMEPATAAARLAILRERGLLYCEEPLPVEFIRERSALRAAQVLPIIADDSTFTLRDLHRELEMETFDILNIKTPRTGFTESLQMLRRAHTAGLGVMIGSQAGTGIGTAQAAIFAALPGIEHPSELSFFLKLKEDIIDRPLALHDGWLQLADALAVRIDPALLQAAAVEA